MDQSVMINESTDTIILGGGIAGYAAAMAASENNHVTLIDKNPALGGATTQTNVGTLCGLYFRSSVPTLVPHDFCKNFVEQLFQIDDQAKLVSLPDDLHVISYEWTNLQHLLNDHLNAKKIRVLLESEIHAVNAEDKKIKSVNVRNTQGEVTLSCNSIIDCSGLGFVGQLLNHEMITSDSYQSAAQVIRLKNLKATNEYSLNLALKKVFVKSASAETWPAIYRSWSVIPGSLRNNTVDLKLQLSRKITDDVGQVSEIKKEVKQSIPRLLAVINQVESLSESAIEIIFPAPGIRSQQTPKGKYILTEQDVMNCRKPNDGIAIGTWPIEEWDYNGKVKLDYFAEDDAYTIPARCLMSPKFENLFFAGKGISAERKAIASARVTGTCLQTGYAAGKIAACKDNQGREKVIQEIHSQISSHA